jgi:HEAT repeat protein
LTKFGKEAVMPLLKHAEESSAPNVYGARYYNNHRFVQILQSIGPDSFAELTKTLNSKSEDDRAMAAQLLGDMSQYCQPSNEESPVMPSSAVDALCKACLNDDSARVRELSALALGRIGPRNSAVAEALTRTLKQDNEPKVRRKCVTALGQVAAKLSEEPAQDIAKTLCNSLANDEYEGVRISAATALGQIKSAGDIAVPALTKALKDPVLDVKTQAINALCNFGPKAAVAVPDLLKDLNEQATAREAQNAVRLLARIGPPAAPAIPMLVKMASGIRPEEQYLQVSFAQAFAAIGPKALPAVPLLIEMLSSSDYSVKREAIHAIGAIGPAAHAAENALKELAERDANLKQEAINTLLLLKKSAHPNLVET